MFVVIGPFERHGKNKHAANRTLKGMGKIRYPSAEMSNDICKADDPIPSWPKADLRVESHEVVYEINNILVMNKLLQKYAAVSLGPYSEVLDTNNSSG